MILQKTIWTVSGNTADRKVPIWHIHMYGCVIVILSTLVPSLVSNKTIDSSAGLVNMLEKRFALNKIQWSCTPCGGFYPEKKVPMSVLRSRRFRVVGGRKSTKPRPWMAFLLIADNNRCAGALLNRRFVLTAAHCVCTHMFCDTDKAGRRFVSDMREMQEKIHIFVGIKDLESVYEEDRRRRLRHQEYNVSFVVVHPGYNDTFYDIALLKTSKPVVMSGKVQPICLPFGKHFPDISNEAVVAGWGTLKNPVCHTGDNGPSPNSQCAFPFVHNRVVFQRCYFGRTPSADDNMCRNFARKHPGALAHARNEVVLYMDHNDTTTHKKCFSTDGGSHGWCATCDILANDSHPNYCGDQGNWEPARVSADKDWGWCNSLCEVDHPRLAHYLKEVTLAVFSPGKCQTLLGVTNTAFGVDIEICAGYVKKKKRQSFVVRTSKNGQHKFEPMGNLESSFDMIGGKDACTGDSGAPLWVDRGHGKNKRAFIVGVVSRGFNCASHNLPGIYVRVKKLLPWIKENIKDGKCDQ